jgi:membrane-associated phospholipid phosphatase
MTSLARWISILGHPFVMAALMVTTTAMQLDGTHALRTSLLVLAITVVPIAILMIRQVRRGSWTNVDASNASERPILFVVGAISLMALLAYLFFAQQQSYLLRGTLITLAMLAVCALATRWIKVSLHLAFATLAAAALLPDSAMGWILVAFIPLLGWSRMAMSRHTVAEVVAGGLIGAAAGIVLHT